MASTNSEAFALLRPNRTTPRHGTRPGRLGDTVGLRGCGADGWRADDARLWAVAPGGTVFGIATRGDGIYGAPAILGAGGTVTPLDTKTTRMQPYTLAVGADDALVVGMYEVSTDPCSACAPHA